MRVWVVEMTPAYETPTKLGTFATPPLAGVAFCKEVRSLAQDTAHIELTLKSAKDSADPLTADVVLRAETALGDAATLTGVFVRGTSDQALRIEDWRDLKLVLEEATQWVTGKHDNRVSEWAADNQATGGAWTLHRNTEIRKP